MTQPAAKDASRVLGLTTRATVAAGRPGQVWHSQSPLRASAAAAFTKGSVVVVDGGRSINTL